MEAGVSSMFPLAVNLLFSIAGIFVTHKILLKCKSMFINAHLFGMDLSKRQSKKIPESQGVIIGTVFLIIMFLFIPVLFYNYLTKTADNEFPHSKFIEYLAALLSICCMIFLGFADDVLNLRWRQKLLLPTIASLPLLMVYFANFGATLIIVPKPFRGIVGFDLDLHILYYVYMGMLAVFCTNAINILAGVNGLEVGQSVIIAASVLIFNIIEIVYGNQPATHEFSIYFLMPFTALCCVLLWHNWYPAEVFVGDTFCYFSGMTFAVVAILGHFSKTLLLFFIPQVFNFLYSVPQLFHFLPCPRHRIPKFDPKANKVGISLMNCERNQIKPLGWIMLKVLSFFRLIQLNEMKSKNSKETVIECNNLTLLNLVLVYTGPLHERTLVLILLSIQIFCSFIAFFIRYQVAKIFYDV
ncbi:UDP-N-acetylglucosamine--dolichyl-phosphate N-acetylglucosaminephosphotransferase [Octopus sinensis]|uniref:UDP-N-acetylglucosamine--dolichyl-phosphate N-acetylglucosaminephosphotransferase n=1 Tax=Octopus sinensis TaxID=2607531 RepID=A0A6P7TAX4_9MOLL|nr:UDP-N-acetylglucosamine--dolichyl-phosphate N-acetylglucosaminephosphotransferase [Octopus sinensis]